MGYLLEVITRLEFESSVELRDAVLKTTIVDMSGRPGACTAADIMQEFFNRLLEAIIEKKGLDYGHRYCRNVLSPNLGHFARIKLSLRSGIGLAPRSGRHTAPHLNPEIQKLLQAYRELDLHKRRPGRVYEDTDRDDFTRGYVKLASGSLAKWTSTTSYQRGFANSTPPIVDVDEDDEDEGLGGRLQTMGLAEVVDGQLEFEVFAEETLIDEFDAFVEENGNGMDIDL